MNPYDLIDRKKKGKTLKENEIEELINHYMIGHVTDYQMAAFSMAVCFRGLSEAETASLTMAMANSGRIIKPDDYSSITADKHSTGGVGDTTTLVLAPLVAAAGLPVAKMSGKGLGHTGGTVDKLEAIPGFRTDLSREEFIDAVTESGIAISGQTEDLVPADKKLYALRDATATVDSIPLIASSIMSKKLAAGSRVIVLDIKLGEGALLSELNEAKKLANSMIKIGRKYDRQICAVISEMSQPLGKAVGNALEVKEAINTLRGCGSQDLEELSLHLGAQMLQLANIVSNLSEGKRIILSKIEDGSALQKLKQLISNQGGNPEIVTENNLLPKAKCIKSIRTKKSGFISKINARNIGVASSLLGAGRIEKNASVDPAAGVVLNNKVGNIVEDNDELAKIHYNPENVHKKIESIEELIRNAYKIQKAPPKKPQEIKEIIK